MGRAPGPDSLHNSESKLAAGDIIANMSTLELTDEQVISLVRGLPAERKRAALLALAQEAQAGREDRLRFGEAQLRRASAERGLEWASKKVSDRKRCQVPFPGLPRTESCRSFPWSEKVPDTFFPCL
jgi:hypothetical protein